MPTAAPRLGQRLGQRRGRISFATGATFTWASVATLATLSATGCVPSAGGPQARPERGQGGTRAGAGSGSPTVAAAPREAERPHLAAPPPPPPTRRVIVIAGREVPVGAEVLTWKDAGGFDGYKETCWFDPSRALPSSPAAGCDTARRYSERKPGWGPLAELVAKRGWTPDLAALQLDQMVIHYDVAWTSQQCFRVLHDLRGLSCHFLLDVDGTIYQTLDVTVRARHAAGANDRAIGIEIAHPGPLELTPALKEYYKQDNQGPWFDLGARSSHPRTKGFVVRPARPAPLRGQIHGTTYTQWDFTEPQYEALAQLIVALRRELPRLALTAPTDHEGRLRLDALSPQELEAYSGLLGHWHVTRNKQDPGPAFDWARVLARVQALEAAAGSSSPGH